LTYKKLKLKKTDPDAMEIDMNQTINEEIWKNALNDWKNEEIKINKKDNIDYIDYFYRIEDKITDYLYQDRKEWESFDNRQNLVKININLIIIKIILYKRKLTFQV
jgi:hypothetical protein